MTCGKLRMLRISGSRVRVWMLSDLWVGTERTACGGFAAPRPRRVRPRRTLSVTYTNSDPSRLATANPPSRDPLAHTWRGCSALRACLTPIRQDALP